ncbi:hypothetical protein CPC16_001430 [Podila verticillata]|nr:hypothetical protein BGZ59_001016 [Podila verticillata]KAF9374208.1 hypothetical protein CPC16_001430 [Podila verticillata]KFH70870.1 hypothetical protein MVEG_03717 [Podila verticillata NRRL 6337]
MSFLTRAAVATTSRSTRVVQKRFDSHAAHHGPEAPPTHEDFTSKGFKYTLITVVGLLAWSRVDEHLTNQGEEKHPFTRYIEYYMRSEEESNRLSEQHIALAEKVAEEVKLSAGATLPPKIQLRYPDLLNSASGKCIQIGTPHVSTDTINPKFH